MDDIRIIYPWMDGVAVLQFLETDNLSIEELAKREVPAGVPYRVISVSDLPDDSNREEWYVEMTEYTDGIGERT